MATTASGPYTATGPYSSRSSPPKWPWVLGCLVLMIIFGGGGLIVVAVLVSGGHGVPGGAGKIGLIRYEGAISEAGEGGLISHGGSRRFIEQCEKARLDNDIKAVVIRINSPGGSAAASQEMYQAVLRLKKANKEVVCSMGEMAASGGYYVAAGCDRIFANGSTLTGSIGVIAQFLEFSPLLKRLGITPNTLKSGALKDAGSPFRSLQPQEREVFHAMIMDVYQQFVDDVVAGRAAPTHGKLTRARVLQLADGRVYTGRQALKVGLVDELGGLQEALRYTAKRAGIAGDPVPVKKIGEMGVLGDLFGAEAESAAQQTVTSAAAAAGKAAGDAMISHLESTTPQLR